MTKKLNKRNQIIAGVSVFAILILFAFILPMLQTSLLPIPIKYDLITENHIVSIHTESEYYIKNGCRSGADCGNKNACDVKATVVGYDESCPLSTCELTGWQCGNYYPAVSKCSSGNECSQSDDYCGRKCDWGTKISGGTVGGTKYSEVDGCAWYVEVKSLDGTVIKEYSAKTANEVWGKSEKYYREEINDKVDGLQVTFVSMEQGLECEQQKWEIRDGNYKYDVCIGNDAGEKFDCERILTKTCTLQCGYNEIINNKCECEPLDDEVIPPVDDGTDTGTDTGNDDEEDKETFLPDTSVIIVGVVLLIGLIIVAVIRIKRK